MPRQISYEVTKTLLDQNSEAVELIFVDISHDDMEGTARLVTDGAPYILDGNEYTATWFQLSAVTDTEQTPSANFRFENINLTTMDMLAGVVGPARVTMRIFPSTFFNLAANPRTVKAGQTATPIYTASALYLVRVDADALAVSGTLRGPDLTREAWPNLRATKALFPGLHQT